MTTNQIGQLTNDDLLSATARAAGGERAATVELLRLLMEVDRRHLYLGQGYSSMFAYCTRALRLSEQAAYARITAARAARRHPALLEPLDTGDLSLSALGLLAPHLTDDSCAGLIHAARGKSTREVERLIAALHPAPDVASSLRALPSPKAHPAETPRLDLDAAMENAPTPGRSAVTPSTVTRPVIAPIAERRYVLRITMSSEAHDRLQRLRALMRHAVPTGDPAAIVDRALSLLLQQVERQKWAASARPRGSRARARQWASAPARAIPAPVRRAVWSRDAGRCAFRGADGRCGETGFLEFHHVVPAAHGGDATIDNIQLRCRAHNFHEAMLVFGERHMTDARLTR